MIVDVRPLVLLVGVVLLPAGAVAQVAISESNLVQYRGGHRFIHNSTVPSPFPVSFVRNAVGIGVVNDLDLPPVLVGGRPVFGLTGNVTFAMLDFEFQSAIKSWLAVRGRLQVNARIGTEVASFISSGVDATTGYELGWLLKVASHERYMLSANVDVRDNTVTTIGVRQLIEDIIDGDPPSLSETTPALRVNTGLRFAYGVSPLLGVTAFGGIGYGESQDRDAADRASFRGGLSVDFDIGPDTGVPLGFLLGYRFESFAEQSDDFIGGTSKWAFRLEYTGRPDLGLGFGISAERIGGEVFARNTLLSGRIDLRYFF